jgi:hypothetical protein
VRQGRKERPGEPVTGEFAGGEYALREPGVFGPEDSGSAAARKGEMAATIRVGRRWRKRACQAKATRGSSRSSIQGWANCGIAQLPVGGGAGVFDDFVRAHGAVGEGEVVAADGEDAGL